MEDAEEEGEGEAVSPTGVLEGSAGVAVGIAVGGGLALELHVAPSVLLGTAAVALALHVAPSVLLGAAAVGVG